MVDLQKETPLLQRSWTSWYRDPILLLALSVVFSLDQVTKALVRHNLALGESVPRDGAFRIVHTFNTGSAFGLFPDQTTFLIVASFVGIAILLVVYRNHPLASFPVKLSLGMQVGGALGNLVDRIRMGQVTDFIDVAFWPVFNIADSAIVVGIVILSIMLLFMGKESKEPVLQGVASTGRIGDGAIFLRSGGVGATVGRHPFVDGEEVLEPFVDLPCVVCDSVMKQIPGGWGCRVCGVKKLVEDGE